MSLIARPSSLFFSTSLDEIPPYPLTFTSLMPALLSWR